MNDTMKQGIQMQLKLATECFNECVHTFNSKLCSKDESKCIENCADRYIALSQRVGKRYQEYQNRVVLEEKLKQAGAT